MLAAASALLPFGATHPTLPTMWTATVNEVQVGIVNESYIMVDKPTPDNPSAKWTNFTDGSCQRLIYYGNLANEGRYLLGCDAVDCCFETQTGNHVEYQIPNVHPAFLTNVKSLGKETISLFDKSSVEADVWSWGFGMEKWVAYTTGSTLHRWTVQTTGQNYTNDYVGYKEPEDVAAFKSQFHVPDICRKAFSCDGQVSAKSLAFLRADTPYVLKAEASGFSAASAHASAARKTRGKSAAHMPPPARPDASSSVGHLLFINNSNVVGGGELSELISLDLASKAMRKISKTLTPIFDYVSSSVVCEGSFYAVATEAPINMGLVAVDIVTGNVSMLSTESSLAHALACSPQAGKLLMVMSEFTKPPTFSLREYDVASQSTKVMYTFPKVSWGGWDSTFSFAKEGELWATFPLGFDIMRQTSGELYIIDTATGNLTEHKKLGPFAGEPYMVVPSDGDKFVWLLAKNGESTADKDLIICSADKSGDKITTSDCRKAPELWGMGLPQATCGGTTYIPAAVGHSPVTPLYAVDSSSAFKLVTTIDIQASDYYFGTLACGLA